jgi:single-strand DNA-binding protein
MINSVFLVGRIATDPAMRHTPTGAEVAVFRIAVGRPGYRTEAGGPPQPGTDFIDVVTWREQAVFVGTCLKKGDLIVLEGRLHVRTWETHDGQKHRVVEVVASRVQALESRAQRQQRDAPPAPAGAPDDEPPPDDDTCADP